MDLHRHLLDRDHGLTGTTRLTGITGSVVAARGRPAPGVLRSRRYPS